MRTSAEIRADMDAAQAQSPDLQRLTSTSQVSFFKLLKDMFVTLCMGVEQRFDTLVSSTNAAIAAGQVGSLAWYVKTVKQFQYGDALSVYDDFRVGYATLNPDKQIVAQAAVTEGTDGRLLLKVAQKQGAIMGPLNTDQLAAFQAYVRQIKYAGVAVDVVSMSPDELKLVVTVKYDRQVLNQYARLLTNNITTPMVDAVVDYVKALPFNSVLNLNELSEFAKTYPGILDFRIEQAFIRASGTTAWTEFTLETLSRAGHMTFINAESQYTLV